jgi:hypothetical protein
MNLNTQTAIETDEKNYDHHSLRDKTDTLDSGELTPCIRYAAAKSDRDPRLTPISKAIPDHARFLGPVYHLTEDQLDRQNNLERPYAIPGETSIAKELSDEAEIEDRVDYLLYAESDDIGERDRYEVYRAMHNAIPEVFGIDPEDCVWYFSGRRSIHLHLPLVAHSNEQLPKIRGIVKDYNQGADVTLDPAIYKKKNLFRLPGTTHEETGYQKVRIGVNCSKTELNKRLVDATQSNSSRTSLTGKELIQESNIVTSPSSSTTTAVPHYRTDPHPPTVGRTSVLEVLSCESDSPEIDPDLPLIKKEDITPAEREEKPTGDSEKRIWFRHQGDYFTPYANATERSVVVFTVKHSAFCNRDEKGRALIPSYIEGGITGGVDSKYESEEQSAPVYLSEIDYQKYEERGIEQGDTVLLIGGRSRKSKLIEIEDTVLAREAASVLRNQGRDEALELLESEGIDIGSSGKVTGNYDNTRSTSGGLSEVGKLQKAVENGKLHIEDDLYHPDRRRILWRLLRIRGVDGAKDWFEDAYGSEYSEEITRKYVNKEAEFHPAINTSGVTEESF